MGGACGGCGGVEKCMGVWWENVVGKRPIGTPVVDGKLTLNKCERKGTRGRQPD